MDLLIYLKIIFIVLTGLLNIIGLAVYYGIKIYLMIKKRGC